MKSRKLMLVKNALRLAVEAGCGKVLLFLNNIRDLSWYESFSSQDRAMLVPVIPREILKDGSINPSFPHIGAWSGNQTRFSRIKYAFLQAVVQGIITPESRVVCVLGPAGRDHLDTVTLHDLSSSWSEDFPFAIDSLVNHKGFFTVLAALDIALDIGALGREGKSVGTIFVIGDTEKVLEHSHAGIFNPFNGYGRKERGIRRPEVVESLKEFAKIDGAIIITDDGVVEAAGRILDIRNPESNKFHGLGSRHRAGAAITSQTQAVAVVVSESTGKVTLFEAGRIVTTLEPLISRRIS